ncbi:phospholipase, PLC-D [Xylariaceae sp. FL0804]|nr:phospholipase, PLC-D [Xylariaceae sp. FL0804]
MRTTVSTTLTALLLCGESLAAPSSSSGGSAPDPAVWDSVRGKIKHVVYLIMENHSFDNIAGYWDYHPDIDNLKNLAAPFCNEYTNPNWTVYNEPINICGRPYTDEVPLTDPDHNFAGTTYQIYRDWYPAANATANMGGFIERQSEKYGATPGDSAFVIQSYSAREGSVLENLARNFALFDAYHAEHPGPTNPNRMFASSGSACGWVDGGHQDGALYKNASSGAFACATSIFEALSAANVSWKNYYETWQSDAWQYAWTHNLTQAQQDSHLARASEFYADLERGTLPQLSYINPECCAVDSMHPTSNMAAGESMLKHLYDAVRRSPYWDSTLLFITFDEHGGFADHVPPPAAGAPAPSDGLTFSGLSDGRNVSYDFTRLGVRVPAMAISPWVAAGRLVHHDGTAWQPGSAYTHTSVLHFLQELWGLGGLNNRVQWAKTFEHIFDLDSPRTDAPLRMPTPEWVGGAAAPQPTAPFVKLNQDYEYYERVLGYS